LKTPLLTLLLIITSFVLGQNGIILTDKNLGESFTKKASLLEDKGHLLYVNDILLMESEFKPCENDVEKIQFTSSTFWVKFKVTNSSSYNHFILETARPITDKVILYEVKNREVVSVQKNGDYIPFRLKPILHRKSLFPIDLEINETKEYLIRLDSDGENIRLPLIINHNIAFYENDNTDLFFNGFYYGFLLLVSFLYFFFYIGSRDRSLLYYSIYVLSIFLLQFTLDGFAAQFIFTESLFLKEVSIVIHTGLSPIFFLLYVREYVKVIKQIKIWNRAYLSGIIILCFIILLTFIRGRVHEIAYPLINIATFITLLVVAFSMVLTFSKRRKVSIFFVIAIITLLVGAILYILSNLNIIKNQFIELYALKIGSALEVLFLSLAMGNKLRDLQLDKEKAQLESLESLEEKNKLIDNQNEMLETQVKERTEELEFQKEQVLEKNKEIIDSINYAKRLQNALIPPLEAVKKIKEELFVLFQPKDIVSGDFYWITETTTSYEDRPNSKRLLFTAADCTGHGVPGAFISIIGLNIFNQTLKEKTVNDPAQALDFLNKEVYNTVNKHKDRFNEGVIKDGMDLAICSINMETLELEFSGAKNPLYIIRDKELIELKGDKQPIGYSDKVTPFSLQKFTLKKGDMVYSSTDGYPDHFGGPKGKKFKYKPFKDLLISISNESTEKQKELLAQKFEDWKGNLEQLDDVCVVGVRI